VCTGINIRTPIPGGQLGVQLPEKMPRGLGGVAYVIMQAQAGSRNTELRENARVVITYGALQRAKKHPIPNIGMLGEREPLELGCLNQKIFLFQR
jgi:hypothetical protein